MQLHVAEASLLILVLGGKVDVVDVLLLLPVLGGKDPIRVSLAANCASHRNPVTQLHPSSFTLLRV